MNDVLEIWIVLRAIYYAFSATVERNDPNACKL